MWSPHIKNSYGNIIMIMMSELKSEEVRNKQRIEEPTIDYWGSVFSHPSLGLS